LCGCRLRQAYDERLVLGEFPLGRFGLEKCGRFTQLLTAGANDRQQLARRWLAPPHRAATRIYPHYALYIQAMSKHLVDIDEGALRAARAELGTDTIKETVNQALRRAGVEHRQAVRKRLDVLARADLVSREQAWR
jgi:Arc/MetJ family transcription regulator